MANRIAVTFQGSDCLRLVPMSKKLDRVEIKFHFIDDSFRIRKFEKSKAKGGFSWQNNISSALFF